MLDGGRIVASPAPGPLPSRPLRGLLQPRSPFAGPLRRGQGTGARPRPPRLPHLRLPGAARRPPPQVVKRLLVADLPLPVVPCSPASAARDRPLGPRVARNPLGRAAPRPTPSAAAAAHALMPDTAGQGSAASALVPVSPAPLVRVVCGRGRNPTLSRYPPGVAVQALRFRRRGPSGPAHATGPAVRRTCRASLA